MTINYMYSLITLFFHSQKWKLFQHLIYHTPPINGASDIDSNEVEMITSFHSVLVKHLQNTLVRAPWEFFQWMRRKVSSRLEAFQSMVHRVMKTSVKDNRHNRKRKKDLNLTTSKYKNLFTFSSMVFYQQSQYWGRKNAIRCFILLTWSFSWVLACTLVCHNLHFSLHLRCCEKKRKVLSDTMARKSTRWT